MKEKPIKDLCKNNVMTQEEKQLLLIDLFARLPYGVKCLVNFKGTKYTMTLKIGSPNSFDNWVFYNEKYSICSNDFKPYLRPMSSMTEEENKKLDEIWLKQTIKEGADYLNSIHVDYRGLIEKGLAIEVTENNNPY